LKESHWTVRHGAHGHAHGEIAALDFMMPGDQFTNRRGESCEMARLNNAAARPPRRANDPAQRGCSRCAAAIGGGRLDTG
jgi:hypothetical protein